MTPRPLLYTYRRCPYAMRARMALLQAAVAFDAHEIALRDKPAALLEASPKGTVPVLVLPGAGVIDQSLDIMRWALAPSDASAWWHRAQSDVCQAFIARVDGPFKQQLDAYKYPERHAGQDRAGPRDEAAAGLLQALERRLAQQRFLGGAEPCAADLAVFPFVRQFRAVDDTWFDAQAWPAMQQWLRGWLASALFERCMRKLPTGTTVLF
jgi:glutathione S-transferase